MVTYSHGWYQKELLCRACKYLWTHCLVLQQSRQGMFAYVILFYSLSFFSFLLRLLRRSHPAAGEKKDG